LSGRPGILFPPRPDLPAARFARRDLRSRPALKRGKGRPLAHPRGGRGRRPAAGVFPFRADGALFLDRVALVRLEQGLDGGSIVPFPGTARNPVTPRPAGLVREGKKEVGKGQVQHAAGGGDSDLIPLFVTANSHGVTPLCRPQAAKIKPWGPSRLLFARRLRYAKPPAARASSLGYFGRLLAPRPEQRLPGQAPGFGGLQLPV
jgi:hypothetical protein